jgi:hypothetical protein
MEQRLAHIETALAALAGQLPPATAPHCEPALTAHAAAPPASPTPPTAQRLVATTLLPDVIRAEAGLRAFDLLGRRAAAVFLNGSGGQVCVYDQDGRPLHQDW